MSLSAWSDQIATTPAPAPRLVTTPKLPVIRLAHEVPPAPAPQIAAVIEHKPVPAQPDKRRGMTFAEIAALEVKAAHLAGRIPRKCGRSTQAAVIEPTKRKAPFKAIPKAPGRTGQPPTIRLEYLKALLVRDMRFSELVREIGPTKWAGEATMRRLRNDGLIAAHWDEAGVSLYTITEAGRAYLEARA